LRGGDTIVLTHPVPAGEAALQTLLEAEAAWPQGLQASEQSEEQTTFKLRVNPWTADGHAGAAARELVCAVLETMHAAGWELTLAADLSRGHRDTVLFRAVPGTPRLACLPDVIALLSTHGSDMLQLANTPAREAAALRAVRAAVAAAWPRGSAGGAAHFGTEPYRVGIAVCRGERDELLVRRPAVKSMPAFKLRGRPFGAERGEDAVHARALVMAALAELAARGWQPIACASVGAQHGHHRGQHHHQSRARRAQRHIPGARPPGGPARRCDAGRLGHRARARPPGAQAGGARGRRAKLERCAACHHGALVIKLASRPWYANGADAVLTRALVYLRGIRRSHAHRLGGRGRGRPVGRGRRQGHLLRKDGT
jgi:hypothetical protein